MKLYASKRHVENRFIVQYILGLGMALVLVAACMAWNIMRDHNGIRSVQHQRIEEDQPGWNCHTMGNQVCGPRHGADPQR